MPQFLTPKGYLGENADEIARAIVVNIANGMTIKLAAAREGITERKINAALVAGQTEIAAREAGESPNPTLEPYVWLVQEIPRAQTSLYQAALNTLKDAIVGGAKTKKTVKRQQVIMVQNALGLMEPRKVTLREESITEHPGDAKMAIAALQSIDPEHWAAQVEYRVSHRYENIINGIARGEIDVEVVAEEVGGETAAMLNRLAEKRKALPSGAFAAADDAELEDD